MSRRAQPFRRGSDLRTPGAALDAMLKGRSATGWNPKDIERAAELKRASSRASVRVPRATRPPRAPRAPR